MSAQRTPDRTALPLAVLDQIDRICDRFEAAWEAGEPPRIEEVLGQIAEAYRPALLRDLLAAELNARRRLGEQPTPAEYAARCPEHAERISDVFLDLELCETPKTALDQPVGRASDTDAGGEPAGAAGCPQRLGGYRIESELGRGGMGVVYRAFDEKRGVAVALKTLKRADSTAILRFKQEFRALADVSHPNLVALHELTADGPSWFFTMELVEGVDFLQLCAMGDRADSPAPGDDRRPGTAEPIITGGSKIGPECIRRHRTLRPEAGRGGPPRSSSSRIQPIAGCPGPAANRPLATGRGGRRSP